jgi:gluconate 5-dehydrogenase
LASTILAKISIFPGVAPRKRQNKIAARSGCRALSARQRIEALALPCDLSEPEAIEPMVSKLLERHGKVDGLVNNAGATWGAPPKCILWKPGKSS